MNYQKPQLIVLSDAVYAIQGVKNGSAADSVIQGSPVHTTNAYDVDE